YKLRAEAVKLLSDLDIEERMLPFVGELDLDGLARRAHTRLVLVDHNELAPHQRDLAPLVDEILDHHEDRGLYRHVRARTIERVGSTATLVTERINTSIPSLLDGCVATLLLGTILLDTANLDTSRTSEKDRSAVGLLVPLVARPAAELF